MRESVRAAKRRHLLLRWVFTVIVAAAAVPLAAQEPIQDDSAPPPPKVLSKDERTQLDALTDVKKRTKLAVLLMELRIKRAEDLHTREADDDMFAELGGFHALIDYTLDFLNSSDKDSGKVLNNFKRFEISLRTFVPRLEVLRRDMPLKFEFYVRRLMLYLRDARAKAVEPLFGDTVVPSKRPE
ncbi:MAG: hypothetical protein ABI539_03420 [Acidobacteriota bacterium]